MSDLEASSILLPQSIMLAVDSVANKQQLCVVKQKNKCVSGGRLF